MSVFYLDTSVLVKRYFPEIGSVWIQSLTDPGVVGVPRAELEQAVSLFRKSLWSLRQYSGARSRAGA